MFQKVKGMTQAQWEGHMAALFDMHYGIARRHFLTAMEVELQPKQRARVAAKALEVKELWDGLY